MRFGEVKCVNVQTGEQLKKRYDECLKRYMNRVMNWAYKWVHNRDEADDIASEAFALLWVRLESIKEGREGAWLYTTVERLCWGVLNKQRRMPTVSWECTTVREDELGDTIADKSPGPSEILEDQVRIQAMMRCVEKLQPSYQSVIAERLKDLTLKQVSLVLEMCQAAVTWRYYEALTRLKRCLAEEGYSI
jgi:RNA polymerase sigma-70 factor (ECF subfamily)